MKESDYWGSLEFRVCREFAGLPDRFFRSLWCDGLIPEQYLLQGRSPCIKGRAWICKGPEQHAWEFTLLLNQPVDSLSEVDWASLMPPENATRWLAVDLPGKRIQIEPSAAEPDK